MVAGLSKISLNIPKFIISFENMKRDRSGSTQFFIIPFEGEMIESPENLAGIVII
jgi:hypothetical protein